MEQARTDFALVATVIILAHLIHTDWRSYIYYVPGTMCPHFGSCRQDRVSDRICEALEVDRRGFAGALAPRFSLGAG